jgi:hypothetical protein
MTAVQMVFPAYRLKAIFGWGKRIFHLKIPSAKKEVVQMVGGALATPGEL